MGDRDRDFGFGRGGGGGGCGDYVSGDGGGSDGVALKGVMWRADVSVL